MDRLITVYLDRPIVTSLIFFLFFFVCADRNVFLIIIGTCTALEMDDSGHFKFCFMAFGASIEGWKYCRPIIFVDGTFLKCKFGGILLTASSQDGNNQIFPLAFAIVDSKNYLSLTLCF